jgi:hypothetical protein
LVVLSVAAFVRVHSAGYTIYATDKTAEFLTENGVANVTTLHKPTSGLQPCMLTRSLDCLLDEYCPMVWSEFANNTIADDTTTCPDIFLSDGTQIY